MHFRKKKEEEACKAEQAAAVSEEDYSESDPKCKKPTGKQCDLYLSEAASTNSHHLSASHPKQLYIMCHG